MSAPVYIECQDCGRVIKGPLTPVEVQQVAARPYDYVWWCWNCASKRRSEAKDG